MAIQIGMLLLGRQQMRIAIIKYFLRNKISNIVVAIFLLSALHSLNSNAMIKYKGPYLSEHALPSTRLLLKPELKSLKYKPTSAQDLNVLWITHLEPNYLVPYNRIATTFFPLEGKAQLRAETGLALIYDDANYSNTSIAGVAKYNEEKNHGNTSTLIGNPINIATGNKYQHEILYRAPGNSPLRYELHYNSQGYQNCWSSSYSRKISKYIVNIFAHLKEARNIPQAKYLALKIQRDDGRILRFSNIFDWERNTTLYTQWRGDSDIKLKVISVNDPQTDELAGIEIQTPDDIAEIYGLDGRLRHIVYGDGSEVDLKYYEGKDSRLASVTDNLGNSLNFAYSGDEVTITVPGGRQFKIMSKGGVVTKITYPDDTPKNELDNPVRVYHYNEAAYTSGANLPFALTGITDQRGKRYAYYEYYADGRGKSSYHSDGAGRIDVSYSDADKSASVTDSQGNITTYSIAVQHGVALPHLISTTACATCEETAYQYDRTNNNLLSKTENGKTTKYGAYNENGHYGYIIENAGTPEQRRTDYRYDPRFKGKVTSIQGPSVIPGKTKSTAYKYNSIGQVSNIIVTGYKLDENGKTTSISRTTSYDYNGPANQVSLIKTSWQVDGNEATDTITFSYYPDSSDQKANRGRLRRVVDSNGKYLRDNMQYTASGQVAAEDRPEGMRLTYAYYPGSDLLKSITETDTISKTSSTTYWTYLPTGEVTSITQNYGTTEAVSAIFSYDDARRLTKMNGSTATNFVNGWPDNLIYDGSANNTSANIQDDLGGPASNFY